MTIKAVFYARDSIQDMGFFVEFVSGENLGQILYFLRIENIDSLAYYVYVVRYTSQKSWRMT